MTLSQTRPSAPRNRTAWFVWLGVALLAVTVLGASKSLQSPGDSAPAGGGSKPDELPAGGFGHIDLEGGVANMGSQVPGEVVEVPVHDGDEVKKGDPLFKVDDSIAQIELARALVAHKESEEQIRLAYAGIEKYEADRAGATKELEGMEAKLRIAQAQVEEAQRLFDSNNLGVEKLKQAKEAVKLAQAGVDGARIKETFLKKQDPEIAVRQARLNWDDKFQLVKKAKLGLDKCTTRAPADGKVLRTFVTVGETLGPNPKQPAVQFAARDRYIVRAEIQQEFAANVHVGQVAEIKDDVRTGPAWYGKVKRVSNWYTHRRSMLQDPLQFNDVRTLEVIIEFDNLPKDLKIGQQVRVSLK